MTAPFIERRVVAAHHVEFRDAGDSTAPTLVGYASVFDSPYEVRDWLGSYTETIQPGAFRRALSAGQDVRLLINHDGLPLARTTTHTLRLAEDSHGLKVEATLDPSDPDVASILPKLRRGDLDQMSFAFSTAPGGDSWNRDYTSRTVTDVDLFDVSVVTYPANPATTVGVRSLNSDLEVTMTRTPEDLFEARANFPAGDNAGPLTAQIAARLTRANAALVELRSEKTLAKADEARQLAPVIAAGDAMVGELEERLSELQNQDARVARANEVRRASGDAGTSTTSVGATEVYRQDQAHEVSFFRDLHSARSGDYSAAERLQRNNAIRAGQSRALSTSAGAGGQFAPPAWLVDKFVALARPSRVVADLLHREELPGGVSSVNLPKISGGTTTAVQATQNTSVSNTDATTTSVSSGITTIAGQQVVSLQLLRQGGVPIDEILLQDLAADYAKQLDLQVISGSGSSGQLAGILGVSGVNAVTFTSASPAVTSATAANSFYNQVVSGINAVAVNRFLPATAIAMHPRRWSWVLQALDTQLRPLVTPNANAQVNGIGDANLFPAAQGAVGQLLGLPCFLDPNIPINLGAGTNQDPVIIFRREDLWLWESPVQAEAFDAPYSNQASVLLRVLGFSALIANRLPAAISVINGTGQIQPAGL